MARVQSQKTRQAVLVTGDPLDPDTLPEKLQLFDDLGNPILFGGGFQRRTLNSGSDSLASGFIGSEDVELHPSVRLFKISTNRPARVRLYPTSTQRDADIPRSIGVKPRGNHGRFLEVVTTPTMLALDLNPAVDITTVDPFSSTFYLSITNLDSETGSVIVTFNYFRTE